MFFPKKAKQQDAVFALYGHIVAKSRQPVFFAQWDVPDTVTGRFDVIALHMALVLRRLRGGDADRKRFSQDLFDFFFKDMDRSLREMGVGDLSVPKRIEKMGEIFYGLAGALTGALDENDGTALADLLARNLLDGDASHADALAAYVQTEADRLDTLPIADLMDGRLTGKEQI